MQTWDCIARSLPSPSAPGHDRRAASGSRARRVPGRAGCLLLAVVLAAPSAKAIGAPPPQDGETIELVFAYGSEKKDWIEGVTTRFNNARIAIGDGRVIRVRTRSMGSGDIIDDLLRNDRRQNDDHLKRAPCNPAEPLRAHVISPAARAFLKIGNAKSREATTENQDLIFEEKNKDDDGCPALVRSPMVIAMWTEAARALECWPPPAKEFRWTKLFDVVRDQRLWKPIRPAGFDETFRYGHTHAAYSNSGLHALFCEGYAASGNFHELTRGEVNDNVERIGQYLSEIESKITHYGESTGTLGREMASRGKNYLTAAVLYENLVIAQNQAYYKANPKAVEPQLVAVYPAEGTFMSDHPIAIVNRDWVGKAEKEAANRYIAFLLERKQQLDAMNFGFRPVDEHINLEPKVFDSRLGVDRAQPKKTLGTPSASVINTLLKIWGEKKRHAEVVLALDMSSSMLEKDAGGGCARYEYAIEAAEEFLDMIGDDDSVSILTFGFESEWSVLDAVMGKDHVMGPGPGDKIPNRKHLKNRLIKDFKPGPIDDTPMYQAIAKAHDHLINRDRRNSRVIIVLSDGADSRPHAEPNIDQLLATIKPRKPDEAIRVITIGFLIDGESHRVVLKSLAEATHGQFFEVVKQDLKVKRDPAKDKDLRQVFKDIITLF